MSADTPVREALPDLPAPDITADEGSERLWSELAHGRVVLGWCTGCDTHVWPPAPRCRRCMRPVDEERTLAGTGRLYSYSVVHRPARGFPAPYVLAYVELDGGPTVMANLVDVELDRLRVGDAVELVAPEPGATYGAFRFRTVAGGEDGAEKVAEKKEEQE